MAVKTSTARTIVAAGTNNAAGGTTTSTTWNLTTALGGLLTTKVTNGATAPAAPCHIKVYTSVDGTNWKLYTDVACTIVNNDVIEESFSLGPEVMYAQVVFTGNDTQAVTVEAFGQEFTSIA